jgi:hypothetical protein
MKTLNIEAIRALKPSGILQAMVDGLLEQDADPRFKINMSTFGRVYPGKIDSGIGFCCGCAATSTLAKLSGMLYSSSSLECIANVPTEWPSIEGPIDIAYSDMQNNCDDIVYFANLESAIDDARQGNLDSLFDFFGIADQHDEDKYDCRFMLASDDWKRQIPEVLQLIKELKADGV